MPAQEAHDYIKTRQSSVSKTVDVCRVCGALRTNHPGMGDPRTWDQGPPRTGGPRPGARMGCPTRSTPSPIQAARGQEDVPRGHKTFKRAQGPIFAEDTRVPWIRPDRTVTRQSEKLCFTTKDREDTKTLVSSEISPCPLVPVFKGTLASSRIWLCHAPKLMNTKIERTQDYPENGNQRTRKES